MCLNSWSLSGDAFREVIRAQGGGTQRRRWVNGSRKGLPVPCKRLLQTHLLKVPDKVEPTYLNLLLLRYLFSHGNEKRNGVLGDRRWKNFILGCEEMWLVHVLKWPHRSHCEELQTLPIEGTGWAWGLSSQCREGCRAVDSDFGSCRLWYYWSLGNWHCSSAVTSEEWVCFLVCWFWLVAFDLYLLCFYFSFFFVCTHISNLKWACLIDVSNFNFSDFESFVSIDKLQKIGN